MKNIKFSLSEEIQKIIKTYNLNDEWNQNIIKDVTKLKDKKIKQISSKRKNLKKLPFVTIDGNDAKDFDDAIYCEKVEKNCKLYVAIADVAHFVKNNSNMIKKQREEARLHIFLVM